MKISILSKWIRIDKNYKQQYNIKNMKKYDFMLKLFEIFVENLTFDAKS